MPAWITLRQLDESLNAPKGTAFRAFRRREPAHAEGTDYRVLHHERDREAIEAMREAGQIYPSTVNLILLSPDFADYVRDQMRLMITDPAE